MQEAYKGAGVRWEICDKGQFVVFLGTGDSTYIAFAFPPF